MLLLSSLRPSKRRRSTRLRLKRPFPSRSLRKLLPPSRRVRRSRFRILEEVVAAEVASTVVAEATASTGVEATVNGVVETITTVSVVAVEVTTRALVRTRTVLSLRLARSPSPVAEATTAHAVAREVNAVATAAPEKAPVAVTAPERRARLSLLSRLSLRLSSE